VQNQRYFIKIEFVFYKDFQHIVKIMRPVVATLLLGLTMVWPPDYVVYHPGQKKVFVLKAGQESDHYIRPQRGANVELQSKYGQYQVVMRSGKVYDKGKTPEYLPEDFKIRAVTDTDMRLVVE
jgi:hypothetical protein